MNKLIAGFLALMISIPATAQGEKLKAYWSLGGSLLTFDDGVDSIKPTQVFGRLGYDFNAYVGVGIEGGFSLIDDELGGVDFDVTTTFLYLKGSLPIGDSSWLYYMVGATNVELTGTLDGISISADDDDIGAGFGYEKFMDTYSIQVDYIIYNNNSGAEVSAINLGFAKHF